MTVDIFWKSCSYVRTSTGGKDYASVDRNVTFAIGLGTMECVYIPILNDVCLEDVNETFSVSISSNINCVVIDASSSIVEITITDDDGESTSLQARSLIYS